MSKDEWADRAAGMHCRTCIFFVRKGFSTVGRCRRHAPTMNGFPVAFENGWCGDHKLSEEGYKNYVLGDRPLDRTFVPEPQGDPKEKLYTDSTGDYTQEAVRVG